MTLTTIPLMPRAPKLPTSLGQGAVLSAGYTLREPSSLATNTTGELSKANISAYVPHSRTTGVCLERWNIR
jgi:hypothetical protein